MNYKFIGPSPKIITQILPSLKSNKKEQLFVRKTHIRFSWLPNLNKENKLKIYWPHLLNSLPKILHFLNKIKKNELKLECGEPTIPTATLLLGSGL